MTKYIFVTGGVVSGLGKGITAACIGRLLKQRGLKVINQKFDPYINIDPGTMSPYQHGEVFVTEDGHESDLDLGHYERFIDENLNVDSNITTGKIYSKILKQEREGYFNGKTVQVVPHITNEIKDTVYRVAKHDKNVDVVITEIGGTVGDIESHPFLEAIRQIPFDIGRENVLYVHVTLVPYISSSGEQKTKPTQHSVKDLQTIGISPDILVCRTEKPLDEESKAKMSLFCNVTKDAVFQNLDARIIYEIPLMLESQGIGDVVMQKLGLEKREADLKEWRGLIDRIMSIPSTNLLNIGIVGKYVELHDAYISCAEALRHAGYQSGVNINIEWVQADKINDKTAEKILGRLDGIIIPGGFGEIVGEGTLTAVRFAREKGIPFFGVCIGMQAMAIEIARNVLKLKDANSVEFNPPTTAPIINAPIGVKIDPNAKALRLGAHTCKLSENSRVAQIYGESIVSERHRNSYEISIEYQEALESAGLKIGALSTSGKHIESLELPAHKWFLGVSFHPEFKSRPNKPHPLYASFIAACKKKG
ncbi:ctp synthase [Holotrichia oblita]|nr:ctp synthase [Holotrichia oblita]